MKEGHTHLQNICYSNLIRGMLVLRAASAGAQKKKKNKITATAVLVSAQGNIQVLQVVANQQRAYAEEEVHTER